MKTIKLFINQLFTFLNHYDMTLHLRSLFVIILFAAGGSLYAQIGIGTQTPNDNAALEITSPDKGLLIPRIDLGSSATTFLNGTGANENGMFVYHTGTGLDGEGLYVWQYDGDAGSGTWLKFAAGEIGEVADGTTANATLHWNGSEWVENTNFTADGSGNTTVGGTLGVTGATTFTGAVTASSTLTVSGLLTASNGLTVSSGAVDLGTGAVDLGTGAVTADGAITANGGITSTGNLSITNDGDPDSPTPGNLSVQGTSTLTGNVTAGGNVTTGGNLAVTGTSTLTGAVTANGAITANGGVTSTGNLSITNDGDPDSPTSGNLEVEGTSEFTGNVTASGDLAVSGKTTLSGALEVGSSTGTNGQILTSTGTGLQWTSLEAAPTVSTVDVTGSVAATVGTLIINANATPADITMTLPTDADAGHTLKIRRNFTYTGTDDSVTIVAGAAQTINGQSAKNLNVGFQSVTLVYIGSNSWVSID